MKKKLLLCLALISIFSVGLAFADNNLTNIKVALNSVTILVNGKEISGQNIIYEGTTYVPLSAISNTLGKNVEWNSKRREVLITDRDVSKSDWKLVRTFEGNGSKDLEEFEIRGNEWKIEWETTKSGLHDLVFQIALDRVSDKNYGITIAMTAGDDKGISNQKHGGTFKLSTYTSQNYKIRIYEKLQ